jgi:hypothetical protein
MTHDGSTLASALASGSSAVSRALAASGAPSASVADFERAFNDPFFASNRRLKYALDAPLSFSLVLADGFSVCYEGVHVKAWLASAVIGALVIIGFPLLGIWARIAYRPVPCASLREPLRALHGTLSSILEDKNLHSNAALYPFASLYLSAVLVGTASLSSRATLTRTFLSLMCVGIITPLGFAVATLRISPYKGSAGWQTSGTVALLLLSSVSSLCSIVLWLAREKGDKATWAAYVPLVFAFPLPFWILFMWWRALSREFAIASLPGTPVGISAADVVDERATAKVVNPLFEEGRVDYAPQQSDRKRLRAARLLRLRESLVAAAKEPVETDVVEQVRAVDHPGEKTSAAVVLQYDVTPRRPGAISAADILRAHHPGPLVQTPRVAELLGLRLLQSSR